MDNGVTIKRQTRAVCGWLVVRQSVGAGLACGYRLYARSVCDTTAPLQLRYAACGVIQVLYAFANWENANMDEP